MELPFLDNVVGQFVPKWKKDVLKKDKDKVIAVDGREGSGKSVLAQQLAIHLDPEFSIDKIAFSAEQFMKMIKDPQRKKGDCIILDEAFLAANSRSAMSCINRAMVGLATEMRQLNLFVIVVLPSFFDLDKYFAIWRTDILLHVYFDKMGDRGRYIAFNHEKKKQLYLKGKKFYNYGVVKSGLPPCRFRKGYVVDEGEYRHRKQQAFRVEKLTALEQRYKDRTVALCLYLHKELNESYDNIGKIIEMKGVSVKKMLYREGVRYAKDLATNNNNILLKEDNLMGEKEVEDGEEIIKTAN